MELFRPFMDMAARAGGRAEALASGLPVVEPAPAALPPGEAPGAPMSAQALTDVMGRLRAEAAEQHRKDHG
jgi:hypothetical protein